MALKLNQPAAAVAAIREMGVLAGVRIERKEAGKPGDFERLSDEELDRELRESLAALGITPATGKEFRDGAEPAMLGILNYEAGIVNPPGEGCRRSKSF